MKTLFFWMMMIILSTFLLQVNIYAQNLEWAQRIGGSDIDGGFNILRGNSGNLYISGSFRQTVDFNTGTDIYELSTGGISSDIFYAKYSPEGSFIWAKSNTGGGWEYTRKMIIDNSENIYLTGNFEGTIDFDPNTGIANLTSNGNEDFFIAKYDSDGNYIWAHNIGGTSYDGIWSIVLDNDGNIYIGGYYSNTVDFDPSTETSICSSVGTSRDMFVGKYNNDFNLIWVKSLGSGEIDQVTDINLDSNGNMYISGTFGNTVDFDTDIGTANLSATGVANVFLAKYDTAFNFQWVKKVSTTVNSDYAFILRNANDESLFIASTFTGIVDFDPEEGTDNITGYYDVFFAKYDNDGNYLWAKKLAGNEWDYLNGAHINSIGELYLIGSFFGTVDFDPGIETANISSTGSTDGFCAKYDSDGNYLWSLKIGGTASDALNGLCIFDIDSLCLTGHFRNTADFDPSEDVYNLTSAGLSDIFFVKYGNIGTSVNEQNTDEINLYPNPASEVLYFDCKNCNNGHIDIFNYMGQLVISQKIQENKIDISKLTSSMYLIMIKTDNFTFRKKIIKE